MKLIVVIVVAAVVAVLSILAMDKLGTPGVGDSTLRTAIAGGLAGIAGAIAGLSGKKKP